MKVIPRWQRSVLNVSIMPQKYHCVMHLLVSVFFCTVFFFSKRDTFHLHQSTVAFTSCAKDGTKNLEGELWRTSLCNPLSLLLLVFNVAWEKNYHCFVCIVSRVSISLCSHFTNLSSHFPMFLILPEEDEDAITVIQSVLASKLAWRFWEFA